MGVVPENKVVAGDCVKGMRGMPAGCADLVFADPPFNIGYKYDIYEDRRAADDYLDWSREWMTAVQQVLKPSGAFWLAIGDEFAAELKVLATRELGFVCRSWVVWYYTFGVHCKTKFTRSHTHIFYLVKDPKQAKFDPRHIKVPSARELVYGDKRAKDGGRMPDDTWILRPQDLPENFTREEDTWYFPRVAGTFKERRGWHGCQMPEKLLGRIIHCCTGEGDLVVDPFGGSGTTFAVAKKLNRRWAGFELSKNYVKQIHARLKSINVGDPLNGKEHPDSDAPMTRNGRRLNRATDENGGPLFKVAKSG